MVGDRMRTQFIRLGLGDRVAMARVLLARNPELVIVILEEEGPRFHVLGGADRREMDRFSGRAANQPEESTLAKFLERRRSSVMRCVPHERFAELVEKDEFKALKKGQRNVLVCEGHNLVGVLTEEAIKAYRQQNRGGTKGPLPSDTRLAGAMKVNLVKIGGQERYYHNRHKR